MWWPSVLSPFENPRLFALWIVGTLSEKKIIWGFTFLQSLTVIEIFENKLLVVSYCTRCKHSFDVPNGTENKKQQVDDASMAKYGDSDMCDFSCHHKRINLFQRSFGLDKYLYFKAAQWVDIFLFIITLCVILRHKHSGQLCTSHLVADKKKCPRDGTS